MNRTGAFQLAQTLIYSFLTIVFISVGVGILFYAASADYFNEDVLKDLTNRLYKEQLLGSPTCFAYEQQSGRVDRGVLDKTHLTHTRLQDCLIVSKEPEVQLPTEVQFVITGGDKIDLSTSSFVTYSGGTVIMPGSALVREGDALRYATVTFFFDRPIYGPAAQEANP